MSFINPFRYIGQFFSALGKCYLLIIFSIKHAQLICSLYRENNHLLYKFGILLVPLRRCSALFDPNLSLSGLNIVMNDKYYRNIYVSMCSLPKPHVDILTDRSVCELQASFIRQSFHDLLGVNISWDQAGVLSYRGGISLIIKEFLERCGYPYTPPINRSDLKHYLNIYVAQSRVFSETQPLRQSHIDEYCQGLDGASLSQLTKGFYLLAWKWNCFKKRMITRKRIAKTKNRQRHDMLVGLNEIMSHKTRCIYEQIILEIQLQALELIIEMENINDVTSEQDLTETMGSLLRSSERMLTFAFH